MTKQNYKSILISGASGSGKSYGLKDIKDQKTTLYINAEGGKPLPFKNEFVHRTIDDPYEVYKYLKEIIEDETQYFTMVIIDTVSFLMDRYESVHVNGAENTMQKWGDYGSFFRNLMFDYVSKCKIPVIFLGHLDTWVDENSGETKHTVPVKGALKKAGLEAYFTTVINTQKVKLKDLTANELLNITPRNKEIGFKHVYQTRTTKRTLGDRIRSPDDLFSDDELYIDNNLQNVIERLVKYYKAP